MIWFLLSLSSSWNFLLEMPGSGSFFYFIFQTWNAFIWKFGGISDLIFLKSVDFKVLFQQFMFQWGNKTLNTCWKLGEFTSTPCLVRHWLWHPCPWCWQALTTVRDDSWERCLDQWSSPNLLEDLGESGAQMNTGLKHFHGFCHKKH